MKQTLCDHCGRRVGELATTAVLNSNKGNMNANLCNLCDAELRLWLRAAQRPAPEKS